MKRFFIVHVCLIIYTSPAFSQPHIWQEDLNRVHELVMEKSGHIFKDYDHKQWEDDYKALVENAKAKSKNEIGVALMGLISKLKDGHSGIWIREMVMPREGTLWFPIRMYYFEEGLYIIASDAKYADCIGLKVEGIGKLSESEVSKRLFEIANGENTYGDMFKAPFLMIYPPILAGLGIIEDERTLPLTVRLSDGSMTQIQVSSQPYSEGLGGFFDQFESPTTNSVRLDRKFNIEWPATKWGVQEPYSLAYLEDQAVLYLKLNVLRDPPNHSLMDTYAQFWDMVETKKVDKVILDLRNNGGGNLNNAWPFIFKINEYPNLNTKNKLIVLVGRKTFSAATAFMSMLESHTNAIFIGEPSGGKPNQTEGTNVFPPPVLDHIGVDVMLSRGRWTHTDPLDDREYLEPDIWIQESISDWLKGMDRPFMRALKL